MDDISRCIATAALTLQSAMLQALIVKTVLTSGEAVEIAERCIAAVVADPDREDAAQIAEVGGSCVEGMRERLAEMAAPHRSTTPTSTARPSWPSSGNVTGLADDASVI